MAYAMNHLKWWLAGAACNVLLFVLILPMLIVLGLVQLLGKGADRAEMELTLAAAEIRTRRERNQFKGFWK